jgi:hypothetical protein
MEQKSSGKTVSLSHQKKRKSKEEQGGNNKHRKKMATHEEHIMDIALKCYFVAGASIRMCGARMFTPQMIADRCKRRECITSLR